MIDHITGKTTSRTIEIIVATDGSTRVETKGFNGAECQQASRFLEATLGRRTDETLTPEFHETACERNRVSESS